LFKLSKLSKLKVDHFITISYFAFSLIIISTYSSYINAEGNDLVYFFRNGSSIVYIEGDNTEANNSTISFFTKESADDNQRGPKTSKLLYEGDPVHMVRSVDQLSLIGVVHGRTLSIIFQDGETIQLEIPAKAIHGQSQGPLEFRTEFITDTARNEDYLVIKFSLRSNNPQNSHPKGIFYVFRGDKSYLTFEGRSWSFLRLKIEEGILRIHELDRHIELASFKVSEPSSVTVSNSGFDSKSTLRFLTPRPYRKIADPEGKSINPIEWMENNVPNLTEEIEEKGFFQPNQKDLNLIERTRTILTKQQRGNVVVLGESGSGTTEFVRSFVGLLVQGQFPEFPQDTPVYFLDGGALTSGIKYIGTIQFRVKAIKEALKARPGILFINNIHTLSGAGSSSTQSSDVLALIQQELADGEIRVIGTSNVEDWNSEIAARPEINSSFIRLHRPVPTREDTIEMLKGWISRYHYPVIEDPILELIVTITEKHDAIGTQPRKSIDFIDEMFAIARGEMIERDSTSERASESAGVSTGESAEDVNTTLFNRQRVLEIASKRYQIDVAEFDPELRRKKLDRLSTELDKAVIGQNRAKEVIIEKTRQAYYQLNDRDKPRIRVFLAGDRGLGKTYLVLEYGRIMELPVVRINMNNYGIGTGRSIEDLFQEITKSVRKNPFTIVFLDEFEKTGPEIQESFLAALDKGTYRVKEGKGLLRSTSVRVDIRNTSFFLASNAGTDYLRKTDRFSDEDFRNALNQDRVSEFVLDRMQAIVPFSHPTKQEFTRIIGLHLNNEIKSIEAQMDIRIRLRHKVKLLQLFTDTFYQQTASSRPVIEAIQNAVRNAVTNHRTIRAGHQPGACISLSLKSPNYTLSNRIPMGFP